ncbi:MAG: tryptophan--tRNA ligase [Candidatus Moranbacteria bacterium RBG_19FT_COMBO_42_6]|nr:MAG: tryptophan--tRNA ligase [Candidatus Moranbacteria bacterium RBG_19FT_COMBO_42_6]
MAQRIFSGVQPSGNLHIGNYLGAIKNWVKLQNEYDSIFCVVDLHAITVPQNSEELKKKTIEVAKIYLAAGIDPKKSNIFIQSHIPEHAELAWVLNTITRMSDLNKMTQFKDKTRRGIKKWKNLEGETIKKEVITSEEYLLHKTGVGLFDYPVLMAADILLYDTNLVPVGEDQLQHIEITRTLANRFNKKFGETFIVPEPFITKEGMRIMGLDDPAKKMSKSAESEYNYIALTDSEEDVRRKIKKAVTDSGSEIVYSDDKPALQNLINIYSLLSDKSIKEIEKMYTGKGYADFKKDLADVVVNFLKPFQKKYNALSDEEVLKILREGAEKVRPLAKKKLEEVKKKIGFVL